ncbi:uncharacterized protein LOC125662161 [Ostrea edulis]|uniref:uncharacterized protein LOC125662161 n=1 Tax=Ostrea edulis TaxID=37623 RepID=UPI0024AFC030|nr:uncharacterized protein LOC125662161 [Ostrea edulis]
MAERICSHYNLRSKRQRADAEESEAQTKRPRRKRRGEESGTISTSTTEHQSQARSSSKKRVHESLAPITGKPPNEESREDGESLEGEVPACSSLYKHYKPDKDGSSSEKSKEKFVSVEIPVLRDDTDLRDENAYVVSDLFLNQGRENASLLYSRKFTPDDRGTIANISEISGIKAEIHLEQLVEATASNDNNGLDISGTSTQLDNAQTDAEQDEYVYRILRFGEGYTGGLHPKNIASRISIQEHVANGSKGIQSRYISCCKTLYGIRKLGGITNESSRIRDVVKINITKLKELRSEVQIIDLTDTSIRINHIRPESNAWGYAERFEEVILRPTSHIPPDYVKYIGKIHKRTFTPMDNA